MHFFCIIEEWQVVSTGIYAFEEIHLSLRGVHGNVPVYMNV